MNRVFADSFYFFAVSKTRDPAHARAAAFTRSFSGRFVVTGWIVTELGDGMCQPSRHPVFTRLAQQLRTDPAVHFIPCDDALMAEGIDLFEQRPDKEWSLTDCISFIVMKREGLTDALAGDHHFEQAGFVAS
jgi:uncharacterized protein